MYKEGREKCINGKILGVSRESGIVGAQDRQSLGKAVSSLHERGLT